MVAVLVAVVSGGCILVRVVSDRSSEEALEPRPHSIVASPPITLRLPAGQAGRVEHDSGARIDVPKGATEGRTTVSIAQVNPPSSPLDVRRAFDFSVNGSQLLGPVTVHIPFELNPGQDAASVRALHWDEERGWWEPVPGLVDEYARTIAVTTDRLTLFSSLSVNVEASCTASPGEVEAGQTLRVISTGTSFTLGAIGIYMAPALARADGVVVTGGSSVRTDVTAVGWGDSFELTYQTALTEPGEYRVYCRVFWASPGTDEKVATPSATVTVGRDGRRSVGADARIEGTYEQRRPTHSEEENDVLIEVLPGAMNGTAASVRPTTASVLTTAARRGSMDRQMERTVARPPCGASTVGGRRTLRPETTAAAPVPDVPASREPSPSRRARSRGSGPAPRRVRAMTPAVGASIGAAAPRRSPPFPGMESLPASPLAKRSSPSMPEAQGRGSTSK